MRLQHQWPPSFSTVDDMMLKNMRICMQTIRKYREFRQSATTMSPTPLTFGHRPRRHRCRQRNIIACTPRWQPQRRRRLRQIWRNPLRMVESWVITICSGKDKSAHLTNLYLITIQFNYVLQISGHGKTQYTIQPSSQTAGGRITASFASGRLAYVYY